MQWCVDCECVEQCRRRVGTRGWECMCSVLSRLISIMCVHFICSVCMYIRRCMTMIYKRASPPGERRSCE